MINNKNLILDEYFRNVCYEFYKRQMFIWVILRYKYLKTAPMSDEDREVLINDNEVFDEFKDDIEAGELPAQLLQPYESQKIIDMTRKINSALSHILWKTKDIKPVGDLSLLEQQIKK